MNQTNTKEMPPVTSVGVTAWDQAEPADQQQAIDALESGAVLFFPALPFSLAADEMEFLSPAILKKSKNVSYNPADGKLGGTICEGDAAARLAKMMARFAASSRRLVETLLPSYRSALAQGRTSLRPAEVEGRSLSERKDDTRLHVDAFPSTPTHGKRILRIFSNINPQGKPRVWRVGEPFNQVTGHFAPALTRPLWGSSRVLQLLGITRSRRTEYDHLMLQLHDRMKRDSQYQSGVDQTEHAFPAGSTWMVFVDSVSHAAMSGQHQLEQTFYIPLDSMRNEELAPLRILERRLGRRLA